MIWNNMVILAVLRIGLGFWVRVKKLRRFIMKNDDK
jgi:hypothetical protein